MLAYYHSLTLTASDLNKLTSTPSHLVVALVVTDQ